MIKNNKLLLGIVTLFIVLFITFYFRTKTNDARIVHIDLDKVYTDFTLSKNYNQEVEKFHQTSQLILDSMELELKMLTQYNSNPSLIESKKEVYFQKRNDFEQIYQQKTQEYSKKVMTQLHQYLKEYGDANNYDYILAKQLNSPVLYTNDSKDITKEILVYVNNRYSGN